MVVNNAVLYSGGHGSNLGLRTDCCDLGGFSVLSENGVIVTYTGS